MGIKTANLAIVFIDLKGYTERTAKQTREESADLIKRYKSLVAPVSKAFKGKLIKGIGDAFLLTFPSPTDAALFGMAAQDYFWRFNEGVEDEDRLEVRVAINVGEVRLEGGDVYGDAVNIAARVESLGDAGDVMLTDAVFLSMNNVEAPTELAGEFKLKGVSDPVRVHRTKRAEREEGEEGPPYGNLALGRIDDDLQKDWAASVGAKLKELPDRLVSLRSNVKLKGAADKLGKLRPNISLKETSEKLTNLKPKSAPVVAGAILASVVLIVLILILTHDPYSDARDLIDEGKPKRALSLLDAHPEQETPVWRALRGHAMTKQKKWDEAVEEFEKAFKLGLEPDDESYLIDDAIEGLDRSDAEATRSLFEKHIGEEGIDGLLDATENIRYWLRWNSANLLKKLGAEEKIDYCQVYILDLLHAGSCSTRRRAAMKLKKIGDDRAVEALEKAKERSEDDNDCMETALDDAIRAIKKR